MSGRVTTRYNWKDLVSTGLAFSGVEITNAGSSDIYLTDLHAFLEEGFSLNTQADGLGVDITGYTLSEKNSQLTRSYGKNVYEKLTITDVLYQTGTIYATGFYSGDITFAEYFNDLQAQVDELITGLAGLNTGSMIEWSGNSDLLDIPMGWMACDGSAISRANYSEFNTLMSNAGYPWGAGDGSTTFNLPKGSFDSGWINRSDWTNVHLGSTITKNVDSNITHGLGAPVSDLNITVLVSTDGTNANSFRVIGNNSDYDGARFTRGQQIYDVDDDNFKVQTGAYGIFYLDDSGVIVELNTQDWYYKVVATPKAMSARSIIKVEHITTAGEPISATQKVIDWSSTSTWTAGASITLNHDLGVSFDEYTGQVFVRDPAVPDKEYKTDISYYVSSSQGSTLNGINGDLNNCYLQMGSGSGGVYLSDSGGLTTVPTTWEYKVVLTKINKVATYADTSFRKVYDITTATNETFTLPDASTMITEYNIKRTGAGSGTVTITTTGIDTIEGSTSDYIMRGDETLRVIPNGTNWAIVSTNEKRVCKAWVNFDGTSAVGTDCTIRDSVNVSSVNHIATGIYVINIAIPMKDTNYSICGMASDDSITSRFVNLVGTTGSASVSSIKIAVIGGVTASDSTTVNAHIFGS